MIRNTVKAANIIKILSKLTFSMSIINVFYVEGLKFVLFL